MHMCCARAIPRALSTSAGRSVGRSDSSFVFGNTSAGPFASISFRNGSPLFPTRQTVYARLLRSHETRWAECIARRRRSRRDRRSIALRSGVLHTRTNSHAIRCRRQQQLRLERTMGPDRHAAAKRDVGDVTKLRHEVAAALPSQTLSTRKRSISKRNERCEVLKSCFVKGVSLSGEQRRRKVSS